jgi:hypothetical protein
MLQREPQRTIAQIDGRRPTKADNIVIKIIKCITIPTDDANETLQIPENNLLIKTRQHTQYPSAYRRLLLTVLCC